MDVNSTLPPVFEVLANTMSTFIGTVQWLVGGIFGLYLIMLILRWYEARMLKKIMTEVRDELRKLNKKK